VQSGGTFVALVQGPDNKTFVVHAGDRFLDGTIKTITPQGLVIVQEVSDPLSRVKQREIRKQLRTFEDTQP
jgi:Tfp pilus assembly protein PilP